MWGGRQLEQPLAKCLQRVATPRWRSLPSRAYTSAVAASSEVRGTACTVPPGTCPGHQPIHRCLTIITGASRGLGAAIARLLAFNGPPVLAAATAPSAVCSKGSDCAARSNTGERATAASAGCTHDMVLLASDNSRLQRLLSQELTPWLQPKQPASAAARATPTSTNITHPTAWATRIRTLCFDLGDLGALEAHTARLLSPSKAIFDHTTDAAAAEQSARPGSTTAIGTALGAARSAVAEKTPDPAIACSGAAHTAAAGLDGVLPLPPSAYTHVLLIHNAGQVGDLVPVELQSLDNICRQTDLNVTSFTHLTSAVLRAFLHAPLTDPDASCEGEPSGGPLGDAGRHAHEQLPPTEGSGANDSAGLREDDASASGLVPVRGGSVTQACAPALASPPVSAPPRRRVITVVNISSVSVDTPYEHFSLYGMGKAARHMIIRSVAHEAALREAGDMAVAAHAAEGVSGAAQATSVGANAAADAPYACVRALSYAPGAIDTEMQAAARAALPAGRLKARFEENARAGRLVDPRVSAAVLYDILARDAYGNGAHLDYYSVTAGGTGSAAHPLAYGTKEATA